MPHQRSEQPTLFELTARDEFATRHLPLVTIPCGSPLATRHSALVTVSLLACHLPLITRHFSFCSWPMLITGHLPLVTVLTPFCGQKLR
jgi:hypothetical protein